MFLKNIKKETKLTISRKLKKRKLKKINIFLSNTNFYLLSTKYNYTIFFFKYHNIKLNTKLLSNLFKEELGFIFSFTN